jgi:hypothetical protein
MSTDALAMWTVYRYPRDYPGKFVARKFLVTAPDPTVTAEMFIADDLDEIRALLPPGLVRIARSPSDDPVIVETWL